MHNHRVSKLAIFFLFSIYRISYSQFEYYKPDTTKNIHRSGDFIASASANVLLKTPNGQQMAAGVKMQLFLGKKFSVDGDLVFSRDYVHFGPGLIGLPLGLLAMGSENGVLFGDNGDGLTEFLFSIAAIALSFEHISYHIPLKNKLDISPFVSILRYKYAYKYGDSSGTNYIGEQLSFATGVQFNKYYGRFVLSPYAEYNIGYKDGISGFNLGVYCGIYFPAK
jgi:hypothetical protein